MNLRPKKTPKLSELARSSGKKRRLTESARFQTAVDLWVEASENGVSLSEFVKAIVDGGADFMEDEAIFYDLDKASEIILKAIGRKDLIG